MLANSVSAEVNRYIIYFQDKADSKFNVSEPEHYLSQRSIERRLDQGVIIDEYDLPVNESYVSALAEIGIKSTYTSRWLNAAIVEADNSDVEKIDLEFVKSFELIARGHRLSERPSDYEFSFSSKQPLIASKDGAFQLESLGLDEIIEDGYTGLGVLIAILDAGFNQVNKSVMFEHLFENNRVIDSKDFVRNELDPFAYDDHGTNVLSCIAAKHKHLTGSASDASFALYVTEDSESEYRIEEINWLLAAERADSVGADIISSSLGYNTFDDKSMDYDYDDTDGNSTIISKAAQFAIDRGILVINSAGNEGRNKQWPYVIFPSDVADVLVVGAVNEDLKYASFSSVGPTIDKRIKPDVVALGRNVTLYLDNNRVDKRSGTSYSTPLITGFAASLWQKYPQLSNIELRNLIVASGSDFEKPNNKTGYGIPHYERVGDKEISMFDVMTNEVIVFPNPFNSNNINVKVEKEYAQERIEFVLFDPRGKEINRIRIENHKKENVYSINVNGQEKGVYILQVNQAGIVKNVKLLRY